MKPLPLTWPTAMHTGKGLQAALEFLEETGVGTRKWMLGPREEVDGFGWSPIGDDGERSGGHERDEGGEEDAETAEVERVG